jgi:hypothetical protein
MSIEESISIDKLAIVCLTLVTVSAIIGVSIYQVNDRVLMAKNIENAIAKGIDPMSVRCSYTRGDDPICIAFGATKNDPVLQSIPVKK